MTAEPKSGKKANAAAPAEPQAAPTLDRHAPAAMSGMPLFLMPSAPVQAKLSVAASGDPAELEADRIADQVLSSPDGEFEVTRGEERIQTKEKPGADSKAPALSPSTIHSLNGNGRPLPQAVREYFEPRFGADFSGVRVHTGEPADRAARRLNAVAFTHGSDIAFRGGTYAPETEPGKRLLAHELTHTLQQKESDEWIQREGMYDHIAPPIDEEYLKEVERKRKRHQDWIKSRDERWGQEIDSQSSTLAQEKERTAMAIMVQRGRMFDVLLGAQTLLQTAFPNFPSTLPADLKEKWNAARQMQDAVQFGIDQQDVSFETQDDARLAFLSFHQAFLEFAIAVEQQQAERAEREGKKYDAEYSRWKSAKEITTMRTGDLGERAFIGGWNLANPPPASPYVAPDPVSPKVRPAIERADAAQSPAEWKKVIADFQALTGFMDTFLLYLLGSNTETAQGFQYFRDLEGRLADLEAQHPVIFRIPAVFYPKDEFVEQDGKVVEFAKGIPWQFYLYHTGVTNTGEPARSGGEWVLVDVTTPKQVKTNKAVSSDFAAAGLAEGAIVDPPIELFAALNTKLRFSEGKLYWRMPSGDHYSLVTTEPWSLSDFLSAIGMALAAVALIAGVILTGGLAAPAAAPALGAIAAAAGIGAAGFSIGATVADMSHRREHGMLTEKDVNRAMLSIAVDLAGAFALGLGRVASASLQAARTTGVVGRYFFLLQRTSKVATGVAMTGDIVQGCVATSDFIAAYRAIQNNPALSDADREKALTKLVMTGFLTAGLLTVSVRGDVKDLTAGGKLQVVDVDANGRPVIGAAEDAIPAAPRVDAEPGKTPGSVVTVKAEPPADAPAAGWSKPKLLAPEAGPPIKDASLPTGKVEVRVYKDERGVVTNIEVRHAADASKADIDIHQRIATMMRKYGGISGRIRAAFASLRKAFGGDVPPIELQMELRKLEMTAAARQERLATEKLTPRQVKDLETELALIQKEIADVEAAIADPSLRGLWEEGVVGLPVKPTKEPGLPDPIKGFQYYYSADTKRWGLRRKAGETRPRFDIEYQGGGPTGLISNRTPLEKRLEGRLLNDDTWKELLKYGYVKGDGNKIVRPAGYAGEGRYLVPLEVDATGRIKISSDPDLPAIRDVAAKEVALAAARKKRKALEQVKKPTAAADVEIDAAAQALADARRKAPKDAYHTVDISPEELIKDPAAQKKLFAEAQDVRDRQQALADQTLTELGLPTGKDKAYSILKREKEDEFIEGVIAKATGRKGYPRLVDMPDIVRGRFNLESEEDVRRVVAKLSDNPNVVEIVKPRPREGVEMGYPRYHVVLKDPKTGILHEWQIGTEATTRVFEGKPGVIKEIEIPRGLKLKEGMHANIHDIEYDIFKAIQESKNPADRALAKKLGIPEFRKKVAELAAKSGQKGAGPPDAFDKEIQALHAEASKILAGIVKARGAAFVTKLFH